MIDASDVQAIMSRSGFDDCPNTVLPKNNIYGNLGPRCNDCSGAGVLGRLGGGSSKCSRCLGTGVEPLTPIEQRELLTLLRKNSEG